MHNEVKLSFASYALYVSKTYLTYPGSPEKTTKTLDTTYTQSGVDDLHEPGLIFLV